MTKKQIEAVLKEHARWLCYSETGARADLRDADLGGADLRGADLRGCIGNMSEIKSMQVETWPIAWTAHVMAIGCEQHTIHEWWGFDDDRILAMHEGALVWWRRWKPILRHIIELDFQPSPSQ